MPRKSHRRRRKKAGQAIMKKLTIREVEALQEQDCLKQESLRRHLDKALSGKRRPPERQIIEKLKARSRYEIRNCRDD